MKGFSLIETLVVVGLFSVVALVIAQATAVSLKGSRKADASTNARENLTQAVNVIERQLRSARNVSAADCTGLPVSAIDYTDQAGRPSSFSCNSISTSCTNTTSSYVASGSARLTTPETICIIACQFICTPSSANLPPTVEIQIEGVNKNTVGVEGASVRLETGVTLRAY